MNDSDIFDIPRGQFSKPWDELDITDNFLFCKIMSKPEYCAEMIHRILGINVASVTVAAPERQMGGTYMSRGIRLDVEAADDRTIYDIELQMTRRADLHRRVRYYQAVMDIDSLNHGMAYDELKETWIIFICDFDQYGFGEPVYRVSQNVVAVQAGKSGGDMTARSVITGYDDGTHRMFINLGACDKIEDRQLRAFMLYLKTKQPQDPFTEDLSREVAFNRQNAEWRKEYMTAGQEFELEKKALRKRYLAEGQDEKGLEDALTLINKYGVSPETAADDLKLSEAARARLFAMKL